jgi:cyanate lyase
MAEPLAGEIAFMTRDDATTLALDAIAARGLTYSQLAENLDKPPVWTAAAVLGQHPFPPAAAAKLGELLGLPDDAVAALQTVPTRGALDAPVPTDPTIYRLYEVIQVYGPALKALIHEEFGDGIMSAINFKLELERVEDPAGDRVRLILDGKFLPYQWG